MNNDRINELYYGEIFDIETQRFARERIHWICSRVEGKKILDIGCSQGITCILLGRENFSCIGIDIEKNAIDFAKSELKKEEETTKNQVDFYVCNATNMEFEENSFDTVILGEILEHLTHPGKVLSEAKRVLKDGGKTIITVPFGLNSHIDHKRTYFPTTFLDLANSYFQTLSLNTMGNYIIYEGRKASEPHFNVGNSYLDATEIIKLLQKVEERCEDQELKFISVSKRLIDLSSRLKEEQEQNKILIKRNNTLLTKEEESQKQIKLQVRIIDRFEAEMKELNKITNERDRFQKKISELEIKINDIEINKENALHYQEKVIKRSARWRIGSFFVGGANLISEATQHPFSFLKQAKLKIRLFQDEIFPSNTESSKKKKINSNNLKYRKIRKKKKISTGEIKFVGILDEFSYQCFAPNVEIIKIRPNEDKDNIEEIQPDAIFVESAWNGNDGAWQYKIAKYAADTGIELVDLLHLANDRKLPSIFWNKEDPTHYERFIDKAKLFDYIFTSDSNTIDRYRRDVNHKRIYPLPFAAQPRIQNPLLDEKRKWNVCFSGTYYGDIFPERKQDMEILLRPALEYGLHIYDRQFGVVDEKNSVYRFPEIYQPAIKGRLDYLDMVNHYKKYKVFLNVNSIKTSPTMFSRRVFELLASGTVVISTYSQGIDELLGSDVVLFTESETDTKKHLEKLLTDDDYWSRLSTLGIRKVLENHTYLHRLNFILKKCNLDTISIKLPRFTILSNVETNDDATYVQSILSQQTYQNFDVILLSDNNQKISTQTVIMRNLPFFKGLNMRYLYDTNEINDSIDGDYLVIINPRDYYGPNYLKDYALSYLYNHDAEIIGKKSYFHQDNLNLKLEEIGNEYLNSSKVLVSTLAVNKNFFGEINFSNLIKQEWFDLSSSGKSILSLDRFNYLKVSGSVRADQTLLKKVVI